MIDLSARTDDRLRYCTNTGSIPSKFYIPDRLKQSKNFWTWSHKIPLLSVCQSFSDKCKSIFLQSCPKEFIRTHSKSAQGKPAKQRNTSRDNVSKWGSFMSLRRTTCRQIRDILASDKGLQLIKHNTPPVINHFSWYGPVCPRSFFCVQQKFDYSVSYKAGTSKVSTFIKSRVPNWFT